MAETTTATAAAEHAAGVPQFDPGPWPAQIFWAVVLFFLLYLLISRVFVPKIGSAISEREDKIAGDIGEARRSRDAARAELDEASREMAAARNRAKQLVLDAQAEAKAAQAARQADVDAKIARSMEEAEARIAAARADAMSHVRAIAADAAQAMVSRLTGAEASRAEIEAALPAA